MGNSILHHGSIQKLLLTALNPELELKSQQVSAVSIKDWEVLLQVAQQQHVTPLLYARLRDKGMKTAVSDPIWQQLRHHHQINTVRNVSIYRELSKISAALQEKGIPLIPLKGAFLADKVYGSIGERVVGDLDLLVPKESMSQVIQLSEELGYKKTQPVVLDVILTQSQHIPPFINREIGLVIEWHWHIMSPTAYYTMPIDGLWQRAVPTSVANIPMLALSAEDLILHIANHVSYHHEFTFGMRSLCDLTVICAFYDADIDWDVVADRAAQWRWQRGVYLALHLAKEHFGATVPQFVLDALRPADFRVGLLETAVSQIFTNPAEFQFVPTAFRNIQGTQGIVNKLGIMRDSLFPSPERMVLRYGIAPGSMSWLKRHLFRWRDLSQQSMRNLWRQTQRNEAIMPAIKRRNELSTWMALEK